MKNKTKLNWKHENQQGISEKGRGSLEKKYENKNMNLNMIHGLNCVRLCKKRLFECYYVIPKKRPVAFELFNSSRG